MFIGLLNFSGLLVTVSTKYVSLKNQPRQTIRTFVDINSNEPVYYLLAVSVDTRGRSCNTFDDSYDQIRIPNKVKNMNVKVINLMSKVNVTRFLVQHESRKCKCRLNGNVCNSKSINKCRCESKQLIDWSSCKDDYTWNPSTRNCEFYKK